MKKIMFNDKYGLTAAVLNSDKTMTRRIIPLTDADRDYLDNAFDWDLRESVIIDRYAKYKVNEVVAVAQPYKDIIDNRVFFVSSITGVSVHRSIMERGKGWTNKMFVASEFMPHHIRFTDLKVERLQSISDEDCLKEGIFQSSWNRYYKYTYPHSKKNYATTKEAFAALIDKVSGKGTWESNPLVFAYTYRLFV